jgi:protoheme IX farnesyltransferase
VTGSLSPLAWCLFAVVFLWTPVHFWALAMLIKKDYSLAGVPMLPVVAGDRRTAARIGAYAALTAVVSSAPALLGAGLPYLVAAVPLNAVLVARSARLGREPDRPAARSLYLYSLLYLALLFLAVAAACALA